MKVHFITYADDVFKNAKKRICKEAMNCRWFNSITSYGPESLDDSFKEKFKHILSQPRIAGYGIWRPYIIKKSLDEIDYGDILVYLDAGCKINVNGKKRFDEYINKVVTNQTGIISFQMPHLEKVWTTKEIFNYFNLEPDGDIGNSGQILDGILIMRKTNTFIKLNDLWLKAVYDNPLLFTDYYNKSQNSYFKDNRHEQSIFSIIRKLNNPLLLTDETYFTPFGNKESLEFPFWATRNKN
jgi:hypothetical protein